MGIPLYGRSWYLKNKEKNQPGAQVVAAVPRHKQSNLSGVMAYYEIEEIFKEAGSSFVYDNQTISSYLHNGGLWVSFDSPEVVGEKIKFARRRDLLGYFLYPISFDNLNHALSKQALEAWERYEDLGSFNGDDRSGEAPSPEGSSQTPTKSADSSNSQSWFRDANNLMQCFVSPLFLLLLFVLIKL